MTAHAAAPAQAPAREVLVARQPVLDADLGLLGYELLLDGAAAVIDALSEVGLDTLTGGYAAWLPLDRVTYRHGLEPLLDAAWGVKLDVAEHGRAGLRRQVAALAGRDLVLIATSVETGDDLALCRELGFTAFQGRVLAEPEIVPGRAVPTAKLEALGSLVGVTASTDFEELEQMIVRDVGMSHKLLRYANSALFFPSQRVGSVHEAMVILGTRAVQRFATVLVLSGVRDQPHALLVTALVRGLMCELLADDPDRRDRAFTVGMFSVINRLLGMPMREALEALPLADDVVAALLRVVVAWEMGDFSAAEGVPGGTDRVARAYRNAVAWADDAAGAAA